MTGPVRISVAQLACMVAIYGEVATLLYLPAVFARSAGPDAWLVVPVAQLGGALPVILALGLLARIRPGKSLAEIAEFCLGRWGALPVNLLMAAYATFLASLITRNVVDLAAFAILPGTPMWVAAGLFAGVVAYLVYHGGEVIARLGTLLLVLVLIAVGFVGLGLLGQVNLIWLRPVFGNGIQSIMAGAVPAFEWFAEVWLFGQFMGIVDQPRKVIRGLLIGQAVAGVILVILVASAVGTFSAPLTQKLWFPTYTLIQQVSMTQVLERLEIILISVWLAGMVLKAGVALWAAGTALARVFKLKHDRTLALPLAAVAVWWSLLWPTATSLIATSNRYFAATLPPIQIGIPVLLLVIAWLKIRRIKQGAGA